MGVCVRLMKIKKKICAECKKYEKEYEKQYEKQYDDYWYTMSINDYESNKIINLSFCSSKCYCLYLRKKMGGCKN